MLLQHNACDLLPQLLHNQSSNRYDKRRPSGRSSFFERLSMRLYSFLLCAVLFSSTVPIELNAAGEEGASIVSRERYRIGILAAAKELNKTVGYIRSGITYHTPLAYGFLVMAYSWLIFFPMRDSLSRGASNIGEVSRAISSIGGVGSLTSEVRDLKQQVALLVQLLNASLHSCSNYTQ